MILTFDAVLPLNSLEWDHYEKKIFLFSKDVKLNKNNIINVSKDF